MEAKHVVVLGGMNIDMVSKAHRFPRPGETITGESFYKGFGGKGANQAIQIARLGVPVNYIGRVGDDDFGKDMIACMRDHGIGTNHMKPVEGCPSGTAMIFVDSSAQNEIVVVSGANDELKPQDIKEAEDTIARAGLLVTPFDIPLETVAEAIRLAARHNVPAVVNPAPVLADDVDPSFLHQVDILVPNETEAEALTGVSHEEPDFAVAAIGKFRKTGTKTVLITLGEQGSMLADSNKMWHVPAFKVDPVDTTAAGDAFVGALAAGYQFFLDLRTLTKFASAVAALAVTKKGAQASLPGRREVEDFLMLNAPELLNNFRTMAEPQS